MNKTEYADYCASVAEFFKQAGIQNLTGDGEPFFSWRQCECCRTTLGGDREVATGWNPTTHEVATYVVCSDCIYFAEYGYLEVEND
jgi:hypothetical protein